MKTLKDLVKEVGVAQSMISEEVVCSDDLRIIAAPYGELPTKLLPGEPIPSRHD